MLAASRHDRQRAMYSDGAGLTKATQINVVYCIVFRDFSFLVTPYDFTLPVRALRFRAAQILPRPGVHDFGHYVVGSIACPCRIRTLRPLGFRPSVPPDRTYGHCHGLFSCQKLACLSRLPTCVHLLTSLSLHTISNTQLRPLTLSVDCQSWPVPPPESILRRA